MKLLKISLCVFIAMYLSACGYSEGVRTAEPVSYVYFTGNAEGAEVTVGKGEAFVVDKLGARKIYKVASGKQQVTITKNGVIVVNRIVLLGDGQSKEFNVPK
ncbi:hypothetical protein H4J56_05960 [Colwellia sp. BRX8-4]|uniref:hypothetical protein n=1 Tax=Colwellia sp. BRX8-4 TaxID=2759836 RepID=UPI0015F55364|nr:hypothetical protein [Colwellia sp. BRX8-4]MBA6364972.1 hypothetical protein [Colwellia sp. BRX8-8]MBA6370970.1 hypothetical protein [Colwellia sp. BRX8-4]